MSLGEGPLPLDPEARAAEGYMSDTPGAVTIVHFFEFESKFSGVVKYSCLVSSSCRAFSMAVLTSHPAFIESAAKVRMALS